MEKILPRWRALGGEVLAVSFTPPTRMKAFIGKNPIPFPIVADPEREGYRAFALRRTTFLAFLRPRTVWRYIRSMLKGYKPVKPEDDDLLQLGGDFLLDAEGRVKWARPSQDATDRPTVAEMLAAIDASFPSTNP